MKTKLIIWIGCICLGLLPSSFLRAQSDFDSLPSIYADQPNRVPALVPIEPASVDAGPASGHAMIARLPAVAPEGSGVTLVQLQHGVLPPPMPPPNSPGLAAPQPMPYSPTTVPPPANSVLSTPLAAGNVAAEPCLPQCESCAGGDCCGGLCGCFDCGSRIWFRGDVLAWWLRGFRVPALATVSPAGTAATDAGILGLPTTSVVYGDERLNDEARAGGRVRVGWWCDDCRGWGLEGDFLGLDDAGTDFFQRSDGDPILARPFFNTDPAVNAQDAHLIAMAGLATGSLIYDSRSQIYSGAGLLRGRLACGGDICCNGSDGLTRVDLLMGYRYFRLGEDLDGLETRRPTSPMVVPGTVIELRDALRTRNDFHGAEFGVHWQRQSGNWVFEMLPRVAMGYVRQRGTLDGSTRSFVPGVADQTVDGGFLVPADRIGNFGEDRFGILPQAELTLSYLMLPNLRLHCGYNFMFLNNVARPGSLIDLALDGRTIGVPPAPGLVPNPVAADNEEIWLHGITYGVTWNF